MNIYDRIYNELINNKLPEVYLYNQEGNINSFNSNLNETAGKRFIDGGTIIKRTPDYYAEFFYDSKDLSLIRNEILAINFCSFSNHSGLNLLDYISSVLNADSDIFVRVKGLLVQDIRKYILEIKEIQIYNTEVDNTLIKTISSYFKNLENIKFIECKIKKDCNFSKIKSNVQLVSSIIEDIRSFSSFRGDLITSRLKIERISSVVILSKKIMFNHIEINNETIKEIFLKCNFPYLKEFSIIKDIFKGYSFEDSFKYLPYSAPILEKLYIEGKVKSLDFLTIFKDLIDCQILSLIDDCGLCSIYVTDGSERKKIKERNKLNIEIRKILNPNEDIRKIESKVEYDRIFNLIRFNQFLSYSEIEKQFLLNNKDIINYFNNKKEENINYYYKSQFDSLRLSKVDSDIDVLRNCGHKIRILENILYFYNFGGFDKKEDYKKIVEGKPFIYYIDGKPIIFDKNFFKRYSIKTVEEAKKIFEKINHSKYHLEVSDYNNFLRFINELKNSNQSVTIGNFEFGLEELSIHSIKPEIEFSKLGKAGKRIKYLYDKHKRLEERKTYLEEKELKFINKLNKLVTDNYDIFTIEEKKYLYINFTKFDYKLTYNINFLTKLNIDIKLDEALFDSINFKTNGLYKKYIMILNLIEMQKKVLGSPNDLVIDKELIKKLNLKI